MEVWIFGSITLLGVLYFGYSLITGGADGDLSVGELSVNVLAAFAAVFGAVGLVGALSGWNLILTVVLAVVAGLVMGRLVVALTRFFLNQQSPSFQPTNQTLIGQFARITIDSPAGKTGEAIIESGMIVKYPAREHSGAALQRGDVVEIVNVENGILIVKRKIG